MTEGPSGRILFNDLVKSYLKFKNMMVMKTDSDSYTVVFTGSPYLVATAFARVSNEACRELLVEE